MKTKNEKIAVTKKTKGKIFPSLNEMYLNLLKCIYVRIRGNLNLNNYQQVYRKMKRPVIKRRKTESA